MCSLWKEIEILLVVIFFFFSSLLLFPSQTLVCLTPVELREVLHTWETGKRRWRQNVPAALEAVRTEMFQREANPLQQLLVKMRMGLASLMMRSRKQKVVLMCFSLSVCPSVFLSFYTHLSLSLSICLSVCLSFFWSQIFFFNGNKIGYMHYLMISHLIFIE